MIFGLGAIIILIWFISSLAEDIRDIKSYKKLLDEIHRAEKKVGKS